MNFVNLDKDWARIDGVFEDRYCYWIVRVVKYRHWINRLVTRIDIGLVSGQ